MHTTDRTATLLPSAPCGPHALLQAERDHRITALEGQIRAMASKLVQERERCRRCDAQLLMLRQRLAAAHMALVDAGLAVPPAPNAAPSALTVAASSTGDDVGARFGCRLSEADAAAIAEPDPLVGRAAGTGDAVEQASDAEAMLRTESGPCGSAQPGMPRPPRRSTTDAIVAGGVTAGPLSFTAAMEGREKGRECKRLEGVCQQYRRQVRCCYDTGLAGSDACLPKTAAAVRSDT